MATDQACYTLISLTSDSEVPSDVKLKDDLQSNDIKLKTNALKRVILMICNGEKINNLLMIVIRFVMPCQNHMVKKLLLLFWEVVPKYGTDGKLLQEMILVCDAYRKDLQHPNEFIRGSTLRFLCKLKESDLLEPLMQSILLCLEHRHSYVRRNAVLAIFTIYKNFSSLIPDAPERIFKFIEQEQDASCKRNAFMMLLHVSQDTALEYLSTCLDQVHQFGDILQLIIVELIYKVCHSNPQERARFIRCVYNLLQSSSASVRYEAAGTLITLTGAPAAIKAVACCYIDLILKESDNNVKLIVLDRLIALRENHEKELQSQVMDVLRILNASDLEVRKKTLRLCLDLMTNRSAEELINVLRKELVKVCGGEGGGASAVDERTYRYHLVHTVYLACVRCPDMVPSVVPTMCELLTYEAEEESGASQPADGGCSAAEEVCRFLREVVHKCPQYKALIIDKVMECCPNIRAGSSILRQALWLLGEYCTTIEEIESLVNVVYLVLGAVPLVEEERARISGEHDGESVLLASDGGVMVSQANKVTADGTYATQTALTSMANISRNKANSDHFKRPTLQAALFAPDFTPGVVLSVALVKIFCRLSDALTLTDKSTDDINRKKNSFAAECMLIIASMIHLAKSDLLQHTVNPDHVDRMWFCLKALADRNPMILGAFSTLCRDKLVEMVQSQETQRRELEPTDDANFVLRKSSTKITQPDTPVHFSLLTGKNDHSDVIDMFDLTMSQALGDISNFGKDKSDIFSTSKLSKVTQLTGFSDPIYAEAYVHVNEYDIVLDILVVNQTNDTLQNLTVELATLGDLKLVEKPSPITMGPHDFTNIKANIKVCSSENGIIFGNIVYDVSGSSGECNCVVLNDIHIDILEYIVPSTCSRGNYRKMWNEFEWENKVTVNTKIRDLHTYLAHITKHTNMRCLTAPEALEGECDYLCVTLYAKSIFGEHVLANICLEKPPGVDDPVTGHVRIRAKSQGMAVTMGEKISSAQKQSLLGVVAA